MVVKGYQWDRIARLAKRFENENIDPETAARLMEGGEYVTRTSNLRKMRSGTGVP